MTQTYKKMKWRMRPLLFFTFILFTCLFLFIAIAVIYVNVTKMLTEQTSETRLELLAEMQQQVTLRIREVEETALSITTHPSLIDIVSSDNLDIYEAILMRKQIHQIIDRYLYTKAFISGIHIYTDRFVGTPITNSEKVMLIDRISWKDDLSRLEHSDSVWLQARNEENLAYYKKPVISYISKIYTHNGEVGGYLAIYLTEESFSGLLANRRTPGDIYILDGGSRHILNNDGAPQSSLQLSEFITDRNHKWALNNEGYETIQHAGHHYLMLFSDYNHAQWRVIEMIPTKVLLKNVDTIRVFVLSIGIIGILISFPLASYLSQRIIKPLPEMLVGFKNVQSGNFSTRLTEQNGIIEFQQLAEGFNRMTAHLEYLLDQVDKENRAKRDAELAALQSQINPHFLYNTLDMINWAAAKQGATDVSVMVAKLAKLFRISLSGGKSFIKLSEELEHCKLYMQIQQTRFSDRFRFLIYADPALSNLYVPKLILQPFVENSIIHGFEDRSFNHYEIIIRVEKSNAEYLLITIEDNGCGFPEHILHAKEISSEFSPKDQGIGKESGGSGYGIENVRQRIQWYFNEKNHDVLMLGNGKSGGASVQIMIPVITSLVKTEEIEEGKR